MTYISWFSDFFSDFFPHISNTFSWICNLLEVMVWAKPGSDLILIVGQCDLYFMANISDSISLTCIYCKFSVMVNSDIVMDFISHIGHCDLYITVQ